MEKGKGRETLETPLSPAETTQVVSLDRLPIELRLMIWNLAVPSSQDILLSFQDQPIKRRRLEEINLSTVCRESRQAALEALEAEEKRRSHVYPSSAGSTPNSIDFENDMLHIPKHVPSPQWWHRVHTFDPGSMVPKIQRLTMPLGALAELCWKRHTVSTPIGFTSSSISKEITPGVEIRYGGVVWFDELREINLVLDDRDYFFREIMENRALYSTYLASNQNPWHHPGTLKSLFRPYIRPYLEPKDWQTIYAKEILSEIDHRVLIDINIDADKSGERLVPLRTTPLSFCVLYPGQDVDFVVTGVEETSINVTKLRGFTYLKSWVSFTLPTVEIEYPDGHMMKTYPGRYMMKKLSLS